MFCLQLYINTSVIVLHKAGVNSGKKTYKHLLSSVGKATINYKIKSYYMYT